MSKDLITLKNHPIFSLQDDEQKNIFQKIESLIKNIEEKQIIDAIKPQLKGLDNPQKTKIKADLKEALSSYSANDLKQKSQRIIENINRHFDSNKQRSLLPPFNKTLNPKVDMNALKTTILRNFKPDQSKLFVLQSDEDIFVLPSEASLALTTEVQKALNNKKKLTEQILNDPTQEFKGPVDPRVLKRGHRISPVSVIQNSTNDSITQKTENITNEEQPIRKPLPADLLSDIESHEQKKNQKINFKIIKENIKKNRQYIDPDSDSEDINVISQPITQKKSLTPSPAEELSATKDTLPSRQHGFIEAVQKQAKQLKKHTPKQEIAPKQEVDNRPISKRSQIINLAKERFNSSNRNSDRNSTKSNDGWER